ncbi:MAG: MATE family efflux transporter [Pseudomonadota bacterium]
MAQPPPTPKISSAESAKAAIAGQASQSAVNKTLLQLSLPLILHAMIGLIVTLADTIIISGYSANAAAAVSMSNQVLLVAYELSAMFGVGAVVLISRRLGNGDEAGAKTIAEAAVAANAIVSTFVAIGLFLGAELFARALNAPASIYADIVIYLRVAAFAIFFNGVMMAASSSLRAYGRTKVILALGVAAYSLYLCVLYALVYGAGPLPELGVLGSALATLIVRTFGAAVLFYVVVSRLHIRLDLFTRVRQLAKEFRGMLKLSYPSAVDNTAYGFYQMILVSFIARFDVAVILSRTFTLAVSAVLTVVLMAISQSNEVMVGYRHGAGKNQQVYACVMRSAFIAAAITTGLAIALYSFSDSLISLFTDNKDIIATCGELLFLTILVQPLSSLNTVIFHSLKTIGDAFVPVLITQIMMWSLSVPLAYFLAVSLEFGVVGLWYVLVFEEGLKTIVLLIRFSILSRRNIAAHV